ncbi:hypothetical protein ACFV0L_42285 [Streptosporangium canum]|uniref:hypothetical protein n=1 Tax=Streptosporangium canum TaxID=324952 RepID=UPI00369DD192
MTREFQAALATPALRAGVTRHLDVELTHDRARALDHLQDLVGAVNPHRGHVEDQW